MKQRRRRPGKHFPGGVSDLEIGQIYGRVLSRCDRNVWIQWMFRFKCKYKKKQIFKLKPASILSATS